MKRRLFLQTPLLAAHASWQPKPKKGVKVEAGKDRFTGTSTNAQGVVGLPLKFPVRTPSQGGVYI
ncbi:hypothetical protein [Spirosoma sp. KNUC1025]|uniref:hypothetical protein n=1 Tax=Spirosoma sp. KNUC1025 TaxID=2894082 RepID=UPI003868A6F1|nr:hypothetical protein LN737_07215 [Spirosoma sp. KNUC1025]